MLTIFRSSERVCTLVVTRVPVALQILGLTPRRRSELFHGLTAFVLSVVGDVPVDSETPVVTSSILRICRPNLQRCS
jgi:hypothetical protein